MNKKQNLQKGIAHLVVILVIVGVIVAALGFVGFNALQKRTSNAGSQDFLGRSSSVSKKFSFGKKLATSRFDKNGVCLLGNYVYINEKIDKKTLNSKAKQYRFNVNYLNDAYQEESITYQHTFAIAKEPYPYNSKASRYVVYDLRGSGGGRVDGDKQYYGSKTNNVLVRTPANKHMIVSKYINGEYKRLIYKNVHSTMQQCTGIKPTQKVSVKYKTGVVSKSADVYLCKSYNRLFMNTKALEKDYGNITYDYTLHTYLSKKPITTYGSGSLSFTDPLNKKERASKLQLILNRSEYPDLKYGHDIVFTSNLNKIRTCK